MFLEFQMFFQPTDDDDDVDNDDDFIQNLLSPSQGAVVCTFDKCFFKD